MGDIAYFFNLEDEQIDVGPMTFNNDIYEIKKII